VYTPDELRRALQERLSPSEMTELKIPFEANEDIRELAVEITRHAASDRQKLASLLAFFRERGYLERYNKTGTRTAAEALDAGDGNCLTYANLFVAMARSVGLEAVYLDASQVVNEVDRTGSLLVNYGHILVGVKMGADVVTIDFDGKAKRFRRFDILTDIEATAEFYSNLGFELSWLYREEGGLASRDALRAFQLATRISPGFARAWNNLGVARGRTGDFQGAVAAYRRAIRADPALPAPHANLAQIHLRNGALDPAVASFRRAVELQPSNEHYRYFLAKALTLSGRYREALGQLQEGLDLNDTLFLLHMQMARIYLKLGDRSRAGRAARRVIELIPGHRDAVRLLECLRDPRCDA
jgi:tetratricopeptide (TPR) repeat protein